MDWMDDYRPVFKGVECKRRSYFYNFHPEHNH